jgi:hypothetical protein
MSVSQLTDPLQHSHSWEATSTSASQIPRILWNSVVNYHVPNSRSQPDQSSSGHTLFPFLGDWFSYYDSVAMMLWTTFPAFPISSQWCTSVWIPWEIPAWPAICDRRRREASWHQDRDAWHRFLLRRDISFMSQWDKCFIVISVHMAVWRVPSDTFVPHTHRCHNRVLGVRASTALFF